MKKLLIITPVLLLVLISFINKNYFIKIKETNSSQGFALIELFTSEGCSSCPAADEAVARVSKDYKNNVYVLGFHVDYWNQLGWKDIFSNSDFTKRQQQYASAFNLNSIYTPQIVVNGKEEFVGSDETKLRNTIQQELNASATSTILLDVKNNNDKSVAVSFKINNADNNIINIALVQLQALSSVKRVENQGRQLHHINIVRDFKTSLINSGNINLLIPPGMPAKDFKIIAFAQNKNDFKITAAAEKLLQ
jgi:hypothetical protein